MNTIQFSIIIPTLNEEKFLPRLLHCLTRQTYQDFEVIIVDGGSVDATKKKALSFKPKLPRLTFCTAHHQNISHQRNFGARHAHGKYLIFFDADTRMPPSFLARIKTACDRGAQFITTYLSADSSDMYDRSIVVLANLVTEIGNTIGTPFVVGANTIVSAAVFKQVGGFDETIKHAEDYSFTQAVRKAGYPLVIIKQPQLEFSLRRYRMEGRLTVLGKNAQAALHLLTQGPITRDLFSYPMGGARYVRLKVLREPLSNQTIRFLESQVKKTLKALEIFR